MSTTSAPLSLRIAKRMYRAGARKLPAVILKPAIAMGRLDRVVTYELAPGVLIDVPLRQNLWDAVDVVNYEHELLEDLTSRVRGLSQPVTFIDCGADIGIVSLHVAAACPNVSRIVAFEPNDKAFVHLQRNLERLAVDTSPVPKGVGDFSGNAKLVSPEYDDTSHARFIVQDPDGDIPVTRVDDVVDGAQSVAMKIDVEGGERAVLEGAAQTLRDATDFVVVFEAHRQVLERTHIDPTEIVRLLQGVRACSLRISERPDVQLDVDRPFFDQVEGANVFNVVVESQGAIVAS